MPERPSMPESWVSASLTDICEILDHKRVPVNNRERNRRIAGKLDADLYPYFGATGQVGVIDDFIFEGEHILLGEDGAPFLEPLKDQAYLVQGRFWVNNHAHILRSMISNKYVYHYLNTVDYSSYVTGTTRLKLTKNALAAIPIHFPSLAEQQRIVAKIEGLFSELEKGIESLKKAGAQLATYRQAVLKHAFDGKLTARWREENKEILETPEQTIATIKKQRSARYEKQNRNWQTAVEVWKEGATGRRRPAKPRRPQDIAIAHTISEVDAPSLLPYGWRWVRLCNIAEVSGGLTKNPKRNALPRKMRYLRVANVYADGILTDDVHKIGVTEEETMSVVLEPGDLLVVEGNGSIEQIGRVAMWQGELHDCGHQNHLIRVRMATEHDPRFVLRFLLSPLGRELITNEASSTSGLHTLSISKVGNLPVPVASIAEEAEIVFQIDHKLSIVDKLADEIEVQLAKSETLRQSILQRAFSGQLVRQDETDEGAFVLLDQIRVEREQLTKRARRRKTAK